MGTCVFVATGANFRVDDFLMTSHFRSAGVFHKGEIPAHRNPHREAREDSGLVLLVSDDANSSHLANQIAEAERFLDQNSQEILRTREFGAESLVLEFGFVPPPKRSSSVALPPNLTLSLGLLGMGVVVSAIPMQPN